MIIFFTLATIAVTLATPIGHINTFSSPGVGWAFSGAGGRLSQQAALAQTLLNGTAPNGQVIIPAVISGVSSGALSAVALNGVLEHAYSNGTRGWSVGAWNQFLFNLRGSSVYRTGVRGFVSALTNLDDGYLLNNDPLETTINDALSRIGYTNFGDLFLPTWITTVDQRTGDNLRLLSTDTQSRNIPLIQILLATTAIPVAFQPRSIPALTSNTLFIDGGVGIDYLPVIPLLDGSNVTSIYGFVPNKDTNNGNNGDGDSLEDNGIIRNTLKAYEIQTNAVLTADLTILGSTAGVTGYLYSATLGRTFSTLSFDNEETQFNLVRDWARQNNPQRLNDSTVYDFNAVLPSYYTSQNDPYNTRNNALFSSAASISVCGVVMALSIVVLL